MQCVRTTGSEEIMQWLEARRCLLLGVWRDYRRGAVADTGGLEGGDPRRECCGMAGVCGQQGRIGAILPIVSRDGMRCGYGEILMLRCAQLSTPGIYSYRCSIDPSRKGKIVGQ